MAVPAHPLRVFPERLALAAFVCLLLVAAGLRFYDLPGHSLRFDEVVVADNSRGALSEVVSNTRYDNSSPILYPLALWAVQKVDVSVFSFRVLPATASVLSVAALLFLLPRAGVSRWATFLAALLATLSVAAIEHAQDAREYSIDALLVVMMIAGLLGYLRDGRKSLLCVSLFLAPLLQYGLVLFGVAVIGAAIVLPPPTLAVPDRIRNWLERRIALVWPAACFLAGCAISYAVTLRYQWREGGFGYLSAYYYQGGFDAPAIFKFSIDGIRRLLTYSFAGTRCRIGGWRIGPNADGIPEEAALQCHCNPGPVGSWHRPFRRPADPLPPGKDSPKPLSGANHIPGGRRCVSLDSRLSVRAHAPGVAGSVAGRRGRRRNSASLSGRYAVGQSIHDT